MSEQSAETRACPTCGNTIPATARYCPSCGTRLNPAEVYSADDFEDALADVLEDPAVEPQLVSDSSPIAPDEPAATPSPSAETTSGQQPEWTARASDWVESNESAWMVAPPTVAAAKPSGNRTLWIVLAIVGFIIFCCCGAFFTLFAIDASTSAFQDDISRLALMSSITR